MLDYRLLIAAALVLTVIYTDGFVLIPKTSRASVVASRSSLLSTTAQHASKAFGALSALPACEVYNNKASCEENGCVFYRGKCIDPPQEK